MLTDVFISHASEDKESFVRPLAERLRSEHVEVWYDEYSLRVGDSLRRSIDRGLQQSRFGIVVLSPSFFAKKWPEWELDGLVARENSGNAGVILPVWHSVDRDDVLAYSPPLADKLAVHTSAGLNEVVRKLLAVIRPQGSTLIVARDHLIEYGLTPPVVTDDWWLDVAAAAESNDLEGGFQEPMGWGRWGFPLPPPARDSVGRGWRLAWAALQMLWQTEVDERPISQLTRPAVVHEFITSQPGLLQACQQHVRYLIAYAPQLAIRGFAGQFEDEIDALYLRSVEVAEARRARNDRSGTALTTDGRSPGCDDEYVLRDPEFGRYKAAHVACGFVQGNYVVNGPPVRYYPHFEYAAWLLSEQSTWLPPDIRALLTRGMAEWGVWPWDRCERQAIEDFGFEDASFTGSFSVELLEAPSGSAVTLCREAHDDLLHRLAFSVQLLDLPEDEATLAQRVLSPDFLGRYLDKRGATRAKR
ncbi:MAG: toll/interleukin-1 receptor domain-containing protein [Kineosporiaceae bacterium]